MFKDWKEKNRNDILRDHFFPYFHVDYLLKIHQDLEHDLEVLEVNYAAMYPIFEKYKVSPIICIWVTSSGAHTVIF